MGGATLGMYIIHVTILTLLDKDHFNFAIDAHGQIWGNVLEVFGFIVLTMITMLLVHLLGKWKWTNYLILGNPLVETKK